MAREVVIVSSQPRSGHLYSDYQGEAMQLSYRSSRAMIAYALCAVFLASWNAGAQEPGPKASSGDRLELALQDGHSDCVIDFGYSADGAWLVTTGADKTVRIWRTADQSCFKTLRGFSANIKQVAVSPGGSRIAMNVRLDKDVLRVFSIPGGSVLQTIASPDGYDFSAIAFSPDGRRILAGTSKGSLIEYDAVTGAIARKTAGHGDMIASCAYAPDGRTFFCVTTDFLSRVDPKLKGPEGIDPCVKVWDGTTGNLLRQARLPDRVASCRVSPDGTKIAVYVDDPKDDRFGSILLLKISDLSTVAGKSGFYGGYCFAPYGDRLFVSIEHTVKLWDPMKDVMTTVASFAREAYRQLSPTPDGRGLAIAAGAAFRNAPLAMQSVSELDIASGRASKFFRGHVDGTDAVKYSPDGKIFVSMTRNGARLDIWNASEYSLKRSVSPTEDGECFYGFDIAADGKIVVAMETEKLLLIEARTGKVLKTYDVSEADRSRVVRVAPDGKSVFLATFAYNPSIVTLATGKIVTLPDSFKNEYTPAVSADLRVCALGHDGSASIVDLAARKTLATFPLGKDIESDPEPVLSPDGKLLAVEDGHGIRVFDTAAGKVLYEVESKRSSLLRFSRDGKTILVSTMLYTDDGWTSRLELVDAASGRVYAQFPAGVFDVRSADISPDGGLCLSAKGAAGITLFNVKSLGGIEISTFDSGDWFAQDRNGRFVCSDGGRKFVRFSKGDAMYEAAQFWDGFFAADLFDRLRAETATPGATSTDAASIQEASRAMPVVAIVEPANSGDVESDVLVVSVRVSDAAGAPLGTPAFLYRNGKAVDRGTRGLQVVSATAGLTKFSVPLEEGDNVIQAAAFDLSGAVEGRSAPLLVKYKPANATKPDLYLLCVGVSAYKDRNIALKAPATDAVAVTNLFKKLASPLYGRVSCATLTDRAATAKGIMGCFQDILAAAGPQDAVVIFFAGHGIIEKEVYYYLPYETDITDLAGSALSIEDINGFVKKVSAGKIAVFLDTCQSGGATKALGAIAMSRGIEERRTIAMLAKARGIGVLAASSASQAAYEPPELGQGLLAYALRTAVAERTAAISTEGAVSMDKLMDEAMSICGDAALKYVKVEQTPIKYMFGQDFAIGLAGR
jgi:WD40 repeat protein